MVRLELNFESEQHYNECNFNSLMVRLELFGRKWIQKTPLKFQFLNGAIRIETQNLIPYIEALFQFLNGAIRMIIKLLRS